MDDADVDRCEGCGDTCVDDPSDGSGDTSARASASVNDAMPSFLDSCGAGSAKGRELPLFFACGETWAEVWREMDKVCA